MKHKKGGFGSVLVAILILLGAAQFLSPAKDVSPGRTQTDAYTARRTERPAPTQEPYRSDSTLTRPPIVTYTTPKPTAQPKAAITIRDVSKYAKLKVGDSSEDVLVLKQRLYDLGYINTATLTRAYTDHTSGVIKQFQQLNDLPVTGIADGQTQALLFSGLALTAAGRAALTEYSIASFSSGAGSQNAGTQSSGGTWSSSSRSGPKVTLKPVVTAPPGAPETYVWIPRTGSKYHRTSTCSNMKNPTQVARSEAISRGYAPCKKCRPK